MAEKYKLLAEGNLGETSGNVTGDVISNDITTSCMVKNAKFHNGTDVDLTVNVKQGDFPVYQSALLSPGDAVKVSDLNEYVGQNKNLSVILDGFKTYPYELYPVYQLEEDTNGGPLRVKGYKWQVVNGLMTLDPTPFFSSDDIMVGGTVSASTEVLAFTERADAKHILCIIHGDRRYSEVNLLDGTVDRRSDNDIISCRNASYFQKQKFYVNSTSFQYYSGDYSNSLYYYGQSSNLGSLNYANMGGGYIDPSSDYAFAWLSGMGNLGTETRSPYTRVIRVNNTAYHSVKDSSTDNSLGSVGNNRVAGICELFIGNIPYIFADLAGGSYDYYCRQPNVTPALGYFLNKGVRTSNLSQTYTNSVLTIGNGLILFANNGYFATEGTARSVYDFSAGYNSPVDVSTNFDFPSIHTVLEKSSHPMSIPQFCETIRLKSTAGDVLYMMDGIEITEA
jgi:hypothetical protein